MSASSLVFPMPRWPVPLRAIGVHSVAWPIAILLFWLASQAGLDVSIGFLALAEGSLAAALSGRFGLAPWWRWINLLFFPCAWMLAQSRIDSLWYLAGFALLALTSLGAIISRVPLFLSSDQAMRETARLIPEGEPARVVDLGCGTGGWLAGIARLRPGVILSGIDTAPLPWLISRLRLHRRADIRFGSLWRVDLSGYDLVYAYLSPAPMGQLWEKARREMRPGSLLVSNTFAIPGVPPDETIELGDMSRSRLLIWRMR